MTFLHWKLEYSLGDPAMDFEHQQMIDLINQCYNRMSSEMDDSAIEQFLGEIHSAISAHFALEEQLMRQSGYDEYAAHKDDHEELLDQIRDMMDFYLQDPQSGKMLLQERLSDWFSAHFSTFDARLHGNLPEH